jgi:hypothetical protein
MIKIAPDSKGSVHVFLLEVVGVDEIGEARSFFRVIYRLAR